ncbi:hypothetical protein LCGC14_1986200 [marine sediment metagenome]|uniref:Uncharacterized protein n=1 Tax=marine sediment metagenome TaxID=412755 RepID=A0A0F9F7F3_9ZZZZ
MKLILRKFRCAHPNARKTQTWNTPYEWNPDKRATTEETIESIAFLNIRDLKATDQKTPETTFWIPYKIKKLL